MDQVSVITQMFEALPDEQKQQFLNAVSAKKVPEPESVKPLMEAIMQKKSGPLPDRPKCPHCGCAEVVKDGHLRGVQRYRCKHCGRTFNLSTNTVRAFSKKDTEVWQKFCECMIEKLSIRKCAEICGISTHTAFDWRHKILDALQNMQSDVKADGVAECDETFFRLSFKGCRHPPRESRHRGGLAKKRGLSEEQVCVPCVVNLNGLSIGKAANLGTPRVEDLKRVTDGRIEEGSIMVTDSLRAYGKVAADNNLTHVMIPKNRHTNGGFNIQTANAYHSELKWLIEHNFKGVATKYLNNYIVWHNLVNFSKDPNKLKTLEEFVFSTGCNTRGCKIRCRDPIPVLRKTTYVYQLMLQSLIV